MNVDQVVVSYVCEGLHRRQHPDLPTVALRVNAGEVEEVLQSMSNLCAMLLVEVATDNDEDPFEILQRVALWRIAG